MNHRPGATLSAGSLTVLPTVRFSPATTVEFIAAANIDLDGILWDRDRVVRSALLTTWPSPDSLGIDREQLQPASPPR
jgi:hypothetical protein